MIIALFVVLAAVIAANVSHDARDVIAKRTTINLELKADNMKKWKPAHEPTFDVFDHDRKISPLIARTGER